MAKTKKKIVAKARKLAPLHIKPDQRDPAHNPAMHCRIPHFINEAVSTDDLMFEKQTQYMLKAASATRAIRSTKIIRMPTANILNDDKVLITCGNRNIGLFLWPVTAFWLWLVEPLTRKGR